MLERNLHSLCLRTLSIAVSLFAYPLFAEDDPSPLHAPPASPEANSPAVLEPDAVFTPPVPTGDCYESVPLVPMASASCPEEESLCTATRLTGDWCGFRSHLEDQGILFNLYGTQFYQGVARGGREEEWEYGGKLDYLGLINGESLFGLKGFFINLHGESRLGTSVNQDDGLLAPSNIAMNFPKEEGNISALTGLKLTQALSENFAVFAGKINTLDEYPLRFNSQLGLDRPGIGGFMNTSLVFNPIAARTVPYSAAAAGFAFLQEGEPVLSVTFMDPEERATIGLENLYDRGVVVVPDLILRGKLFGRPTGINLGGTYSNADYRSLSRESYLIIPDFGIMGGEESGSWSLYANGFHALWVDSDNENRAWGVFGQFGISDGNPNPIRYVANGGLAGRSMIPGRTIDTFGAAFFYLGLSQDFKSLTAPILPQQDEYGAEFFYNFAVTPACRFTTDLQIVRPSTKGFDTAIIPGVRLELVF